MKKIESDIPLSRLKSGEPLFEVRIVNENGMTEAWHVDASIWSFVVAQLAGHVKLRALDDGVDLRLATQRTSIDNLLSHLKKHCPKFADVPGKCDHRNGE